MLYYNRLVLTIGVVLLFSFVGLAQTPVQTFGIDFSPYLNGQDPNLGSQISNAQITARLQIIAPYTKWVRSFGSTNGLENIPAIAHQLGLKVAANAWISSNTAQNAIEISNLIANANAGLVDIAIVGSETILRNDVTVTRLISYMDQVRQAIPASIPVTTADIWGTFIDNPSLIAASDILFVNFYPYWEGTSISNAACSLQQEYQELVTAAGSKTVVISETGWPSAGNVVGGAVPSDGNASLYTEQVLSWANGNNIQSFFFEAFDEAWKANYEGPQGAHWGIWDTSGDVNPGRDAFFNGQANLPTCDGTIPGPVGIGFSYVPPYGSSNVLEVQVTGVKPSAYVIATYIKVFGGWWTKPFSAQPTVAINPDGTARIRIVTGGSDAIATEITAFLIPSNVTPPAASGGSLPSIPSAIATTDVSRTQASVSGSVTDLQSRPVIGAVISDPILGSTTSAPDGNYSFYSIVAAGTASLTVSYPGEVFAGSPAVFSIPTSNKTVNFVGAPTLVVVPTLLPEGATGAPYEQTLSAVGGAPPYGNWSVVDGALPPGLVLSAATGTISGTPTTTAGSPFSLSATVTDRLGNISPPVMFSITIVPGIPTTVMLMGATNATLGQLVTLTATITPAPAAGKATFYQGTNVVGTRALSNGVATLNTTLLSQGAKPIAARFLGYGADLASTSSSFQLRISARQATLQNATSLGLIANPIAVVVGDFNGDNKADLAFANYVPAATVTVLLGNGDGTFQSPKTSVATDSVNGPWSLAVGDFDGDGYPDLATVNGTRVYILLGKGNGTFQPPFSFSADNDPLSLVVGDFNRDGIPDLAVANYQSNDVSILLGKGDGTFLSAVNFAVAANPLSVTTGDFNGDGKTDLVVANSGGNDITVLLGNGDGAFQTGVNYPADTGTRSVAVGDFNNDSHLDIAAANENGNNVSVFLGNGDGTFGAAANIAIGQTPYAVVVADVNGDGLSDLVAAKFTGGGNILLGKGDGTFQPATMFTAGSVSRSLAVADFNGDGGTDITVANSGDGSILFGSVVPREKPKGQITSQ